MSNGEIVNIANTVVRYRMTDEVARLIVERFNRRSKDGLSVSYMDCSVFDAALDRLGMTKGYYGMTDDEYKESVREMDDILKRYSVRWVDIGDEKSLAALLSDDM